jgi:hypothetical protein
VTSKNHSPTIYYNNVGRSDATARIENVNFRAPVASPMLRIPLDVNSAPPWRSPADQVGIQASACPSSSSPRLSPVSVHLR